MLVIYEFIEETQDEEYRAQGENNKEVIDWFNKNEKVKLTTQNIYKAKRQGGLVIGRYHIYDIDLEGEDW